MTTPFAPLISPKNTSWFHYGGMSVGLPFVPKLQSNPQPPSQPLAYIALLALPHLICVCRCRTELSKNRKTIDRTSVNKRHRSRGRPPRPSCLGLTVRQQRAPCGSTGRDVQGRLMEVPLQPGSSKPGGSCPSNFELH